MDKKYFSYGISKRSPFAYASGVFVLASIVIRIVYYILCGSDAEGVGSAWFPFFFWVLPIGAGLWFAYALFVHGEKRLYKTITPILLGAVFFIARILSLYVDKNDTTVVYWWQPTLAIAICIIAFFIYCPTVNAGRIRTRIPAVIMFVLPLLCHVVFEVLPGIPDHPEFRYWLGEISLGFMFLSVISVLIGMKQIVSSRPLPRRGDRNDGRRLRTLDPISGVGVYIMGERNSSKNLFRDSFECTNAEKYIRQKRASGLTNFGFTHLLLAAYIRTISQVPSINRFIAGQKIYSKDDEIEVCMAIKKDMSTEGSETIITVFFDPHDTAEDVYNKFNKVVQEVKSTQELNSSFDKTAGILNCIPGVLMKFTIWFIKLLDYFGLLPRELLKVSPFHGSMFITSMGSLGIPPIYHHLYDFGNIPVFLAFGMKHRQNELKPDGTIEPHKYIGFTVACDDRICDGFNYAAAFKHFKRYLHHPERLDLPPDEVKRDVD